MSCRLVSGGIGELRNDSPKRSPWMSPRRLFGCQSGAWLAVDAAGRGGAGRWRRATDLKAQGQMIDGGKESQENTADLEDMWQRQPQQQQQPASGANRAGPAAILTPAVVLAGFRSETPAERVRATWNGIGRSQTARHSLRVWGARARPGGGSRPVRPAPAAPGRPKSQTAQHMLQRERAHAATSASSTARHPPKSTARADRSYVSPSPLSGLRVCLVFPNVRG